MSFAFLLLSINVHYISIDLDANASDKLNAVDSIDIDIDSMEKDDISIDSDTDASNKLNAVDSINIDSDADASDGLNTVLMLIRMLLLLMNQTK